MRSLSTILMASVMIGCSAASDVAETDETPDQGEAALSNPNFGYFVARPDLRKCIAPLCGGYWVHRVNSSSTLCTDGSYQKECYVASIDLSGTGLTGDEQAKVDPGRSVIRGTIKKEQIGNFTMGVFHAGEAWVGETGSAPQGYFYRAKDNGIKCFKAPCPSTSAAKLNTSSVKNITDINLSGTGASQKQIDAAIDDLFTQQGLLVAGTIAATKNGGHSLVGTEFYHLAKTSVHLCGSRGLGQCADNEYCAFDQKAMCGVADAPGVCAPRPEVCIQLYKPVCGCDGQTYSNSCHAAGAGVSVAHDGACK